MRRLRLQATVLALVLVCALLNTQAAGPGNPERPPKGSMAPAQTLASSVEPPWAGQVPIAARSKIAPRLLKQLLEAEQDAHLRSGRRPTPVTYLVHLRERAALQDLKQVPALASRRQLVVGRLQATARRSQAGVTTYLEQQLKGGRIARYKSYWVFNGLAVEGDLETAIQLALRPEVESLRPNRVHRLAPPGRSGATAMSLLDPEWNMAKIDADRVWDALGITGEGIVVANLDSGVDWTHPALQRKYRGYDSEDPASSVHDYNWFDATGTYPEAPGPNQANISQYSDHGTHTMGTMVGSESDGSNVIGVAPGAQWVAGKVFDDDGMALDEWIHDGFQWCLAPTDLSGENPDPSKAPDIVNNSWGDDNGADAYFLQDVEALRAAGIFATFSAGNAGPNPGTVGSPASFPTAFGVGATDASDSIAYFSSRGPSPWGEIKPEVVAPGVNIRSSIAGGSYQGGWNGTSMAAPHVAGLAALLWQADRQSANPSLTVTTTEYVITSTAVDLGDPGGDNVYGSGRIDAYEAVLIILEAGTLEGQVTGADSGGPIADAQIAVENLETGGQTAVHTQADGSYSLSLGAGRYDATASKFGYEDAIASGVQITAEQRTQRDFVLQPMPSGTLWGQVTRSPDGQAITATVSLVGTPAQTSTDPQGYYTITAPVGTYTVCVLPSVVGYRGAEVMGVEIAEGSLVELDFELSTAPRLLLVGADVSVPIAYLSYYQGALTELLYSYDTWRILDPPEDNPSASALAKYDIVIWAQPEGSPGYIGAWDSLSAYLDGGGRLFISGQDIGYWDYQRGYGADAYANYLRARYLDDDGGLAALVGVTGEILAGVKLVYNSDDSAKNQVSPDDIAPRDALARRIIGPSPSAAAGLRVDACTHRAVYLSFGLEGVGSAAARGQALSQVIDWLATERPTMGVGLSVPTLSRGAVAGGTTAYEVCVANDGQVAQAYQLSVESPLWPATLVDAQTGVVVTETGTLSPCQVARLELEVTVPESAVASEMATTTVRTSVASTPAISATQSVRTTAFQQWVASASLPTARYRLTAAASDCSLYAIGGFVGNGSATALASVEILDLSTGSWLNGASKPTPAGNSAVAQLDGRIYVIGGYDPADGGECLDAVEIYDPDTDTWDTETAPSLPKALSGMAAVALADKIYAFGGSASEGDSTADYVYDPVEGKWSYLGEMPSASFSFGGAVSLNGSIYLAGGWPNSKQFYRYDPVYDSWVSLAPMQVGRHSFAMAAVGGHIYVAGGGDSWDGLSSAERYDPSTNTWMEILPLGVSGRAGTAGAYADGELYVLGGIGDVPTGSVESLNVDATLAGSYFGLDAPVSQEGGRLHCSLQVRNPTSQEVSAIWWHALPQELEYVKGSATGGATYDAGPRRVSWSGTVPGHDTLFFGFEAEVGDVPDDTLITSTLHLDGGGCAPRQLAAATRVSTPSLARSSKAVDGTEVTPGATLRYTVTVANGSPFTISSASLVDPIPAHTTYVQGSVGGGATYNAELNRIEWSGTLPPAEPTWDAFDWLDATGGEALDLSDDSCVGPLDLGFDFEFYGQTYSQIFVSSNGMVLFEQCDITYENATTIPTTTLPNGYVAPFWDDLEPDGGVVYFATPGTAPRPRAVIEWKGVRPYGESYPQTFEVVLLEESNSVVFQYLDVSGIRGTGSSATVGIENQDGTLGVGYLANGSPSNHALYDGLAIELEHSSTRKSSTHLVSYEVVIDDPVPPLVTVINNTAWIDDGLLLHERSAAVGHWLTFMPWVRNVEPQ